MSRPVVVNLGLPKSGTTTLARALREAGFTVADYRLRRSDAGQTRRRGRYVAGRIYSGYFTHGDPLHELSEYNAFSEISMIRAAQSFWPQTDFGVIDAIEKHHPGVRFLASARDPQAQSMSLLRWSDLGANRLPKLTVPGLPRGFGETGHERIRWIEAHHAFLRRIFAGRDNFLEYDIADPQAPAKIGAFLGRDLPWWGRLNANKGALPPVKLVKVQS